MKKSAHSESQIFAIVKEGETEIAVGQILRKHGINDATYYNLKSKYGDTVSQVKIPVNGKKFVMNSAKTVSVSL
jgi:Transposase